MPQQRAAWEGAQDLISERVCIFPAVTLNSMVKQPFFNTQKAQVYSTMEGPLPPPRTSQSPYATCSRKEEMLRKKHTTHPNQQPGRKKENEQLGQGKEKSARTQRSVTLLLLLID